MITPNQLADYAARQAWMLVFSVFAVGGIIGAGVYWLFQLVAGWAQ
jgi:hypothetical protein